MNNAEMTPDPQADPIAMPEAPVPESPDQAGVAVAAGVAQEIHPSPFLDIISGQFDVEDAGVADDPLV